MKGVALRFIDIHCHIIPGVDDGPADMGSSVEMAKMAVNDGITDIIATPHILEGFYLGEDREQRLDQLRSELSKANIAVTLHAGAEVPMSLCLAGNEELLRTLTLAGGRYLLVETSDTTFDQVAQAVYRIQLCGLFPVLAHPERTAFVREDPSRLDEMLGRHACIQVTAASLEGIFGKTIKKTAMSLLRSGLVHIIATDAHSIGRRSPRLSNCYSILSKEIGEPAAQVIMLENPARIISNAPIEPKACISIPRKKGFLAKLLQRR